MTYSLSSLARPKLEIISGNGRVTSPAVDERIALDHFERYIGEWLSDCKIIGLSDRTIDFRRHSTGLLLRYLKTEQITEVGRSELRLYFHHLATGHTKPQGRWGNGTARDKKALSSGTKSQAFEVLKQFYNWMIAQEIVSGSPLNKAWAPVAKSDQITPFQDDHLKRLREKIKSTRHALRDEAAFYTLLGTGIRASEFCALQMQHLDLSSRTIFIQNGKGGKDRTVGIGRTTTLALRRYIRDSDIVNAETGQRLRMPELPVFMSARQTAHGRFMSASSLSNIVSDWGDLAGITGVRCSPHTFRHTFAIKFLKNGGSIRALQNLLGHEDLQMTMRYLKYSEADQIEEHHLHDVVDGMKFF